MAQALTTFLENCFKIVIARVVPMIQTGQVGIRSPEVHHRYRGGDACAARLIQRFGSALNLNMPRAPSLDAAHQFTLSTFTSCSWMASMCIATIDRPDFNASRHRTKANWRNWFN